MVRSHASERFPQGSDKTDELTGEAHIMKELISKIAQALVDNPEAVTVDDVQGEHTTVLKLKVDKSDLGKIIGKKGNTARALRTLLTAASGKTRKRHFLEIVE